MKIFKDEPELVLLFLLFAMGMGTIITVNVLHQINMARIMAHGTEQKIILEKIRQESPTCPTCQKSRTEQRRK